MTSVAGLWREGGLKEAPAWLQEAVQDLATHAKLPSGLRVTVRVLGSQELNAFATVDGRIFITAGLLERAGLSREEVAALAAHELGHLERQDAVWHACYARHDLGFDQQGAEFEADRVALRLLRARGNAPHALRLALQKLDRLAPSSPTSATHPATRERVRILQIVEGASTR